MFDIESKFNSETLKSSFNVPLSMYGDHLQSMMPNLKIMEIPSCAKKVQEKCAEGKEDGMGYLAPGDQHLSALNRTGPVRSSSPCMSIVGSSRSHISQATSVWSYFLKYIHMYSQLFFFMAVLIIHENAKNPSSELFLFQKQTSKFICKPNETAH